MLANNLLLLLLSRKAKNASLGFHSEDKLRVALLDRVSFLKISRQHNNHGWQLLGLIMLLVFVMTAYSSQSTDGIPETENNAVNNLDGLVNHLGELGVQTELSERVSQPFFTPNAQIVKVNGSDVQVFEFADDDSQETAQSTISPEGTAIGTTMISWMDTPHFWGKGKLIVLFVGNNTEIIEILNSIFKE